MAKKIDIQIREAFKNFINEQNQRIVAKGLIEDNRLFSQLNKLIVADAFNELGVRILMGEVKEYYSKNGKVPTYEVLDSLMRRKANNEIETEEYIALLNELKQEKSLSNLHDFKHLAIQFFKQQETIKLSNKLHDSIRKGYEDNILKNMIDEAKEIITPTDNDLGASPDEYMEEIFNDEDEEKIPTGYFELDAVLGGGLQRGNVGLLAAHTGAGKTTFSTAMAVQAAIQGYKVLQIVFEESEKDIIKKQYACLTKDYVSNMNRNRISDKTKAEVRKWMPIISDKIIVKRLKNTKTTWDEVENYVFNLMMVRNFDPDVIFIDYFDCLKHTTDPKLMPVQAATRCIKKIDEFAKTNKKAVWVMQQTNRQGAQAATRGDVEGNIQGAFAVQQTTAVNMYLTKTEEEKATNCATLTLKKNRQGCLCTFESFYFNNGTLQIDMSNATTSADVELAIAEFNSSKRKDWKNVEGELQKQYIQTQNENNQSKNNVSTICDINPQTDWPDNF